MIDEITLYYRVYRRAFRKTLRKGKALKLKRLRTLKRSLHTLKSAPCKKKTMTLHLLSLNDVHNVHEMKQRIAYERLGQLGESLVPAVIKKKRSRP